MISTTNSYTARDVFMSYQTHSAETRSPTRRHTERGPRKSIRHHSQSAQPAPATSKLQSSYLCPPLNGTCHHHSPRADLSSKEETEWRPRPTTRSRSSKMMPIVKESSKRLQRQEHSIASQRKHTASAKEFYRDACADGTRMAATLNTTQAAIQDSGSQSSQSHYVHLYFTATIRYLSLATMAFETRTELFANGTTGKA